MRTNTVLIRLVFIGILIGAGFVLDPIGAKYAAHPAVTPFGLPTQVLSALLAFVIAVAIILFEIRIQRASLKTLIGAGVGSIMGIVGGVLIGFLISYQEAGAVNPSTKAFLTLALAFIMAYVGLMVGAAKGDYLDLSALGGIFSDKVTRKDVKILDIQVIDTDFPAVKEVDLKLLELSKSLDGVVVTNDFNLNKVAQLHGIQVLNINELANSLKPVVLPGEAMRVFILKEGKEYNQGVAYLDDRTMVVVDNARKMISKTIDIVVTSVLQTTAGKMIFGRFIEAGMPAPAPAAAPPTPPDRDKDDNRA